MYCHIHFNHEHNADSFTDYETVNETVTFAPCESRRCVNVKITADLVNEQNETFSLNLTRTINTHFFIGPGSTTAEVVVIDDCKCKVFFCFFKREEAYFSLLCQGSVKKPKNKMGHRDGSKHRTHMT